MIKLNRANLIKIQELMGPDGLSPEAVFAMDTFCRIPDRHSLGGKVDSFRRVPPAEWIECGAVCCAAGWSVGRVLELREGEPFQAFMDRLAIESIDGLDYRGILEYSRDQRDLISTIRDWLFAYRWADSRFGGRVDVIVRIQALLDCEALGSERWGVKLSWLSSVRSGYMNVKLWNQDMVIRGLLS